MMNWLSRLLRHIRSISTPFGRISWEPSQDEREIVRQLMLFIEDRRVLYNPFISEVPDHAIDSVFLIRERLMQTLQEVKEKSPAVKDIKAMQEACRIFLNQANKDHSSSQLQQPLEELRSVFAESISSFCSSYSIDSDLAGRIRLQCMEALGPG